MRNKLKKFVISKATLKELEDEKNRLSIQAAVERKYLIHADLHKRIEKIEEIEEALNFNSNVLYKLSCQTRVKPGLINLLVHNTEITPEAKAKIERGRKIQERLNIQLAECDPDGCRKQLNAIDVIQKNERQIELIQRKIDHIKKRKREITALKNKAAAHTIEKRNIGNSLRKAIEKNEICPYCSKPITDGGHIDHIYPIAKGGHSVIENMVHVCSKCNSKKGEMTLNQFMEKFQLNRDAIEKKLRDLGKII